MTLLTVCNNPTGTKTNLLLDEITRTWSNPRFLKISNTPTGPRTIPLQWVQNWNRRLYPKVKNRTTLPRLITNRYLSLILRTGFYRREIPVFHLAYEGGHALGVSPLGRPEHPWELLKDAWDIKFQSFFHREGPHPMGLPQNSSPQTRAVMPYAFPHLGASLGPGELS
jgi:hypothetical protein